jgi:hypothetical protein
VSLYGSSPDLRAIAEGRPMEPMGCGGVCPLCRCWEYTASGRLVRPRARDAVPGARDLAVTTVPRTPPPGTVTTRR